MTDIPSAALTQHMAVLGKTRLRQELHDAQAGSGDRGARSEAWGPVRRRRGGPQRAGAHGLDRVALCEALGWNATSGHIKNVLGSMRSMELVEYPTQGSVKLVDWIIDRPGCRDC